MPFSNDGDRIADQAESIWSGGDGRILHLIGLGVLLPLAILGAAVFAWSKQKAIWFALEGSGSFIVEGEAARILAGAYACAAVFFHGVYFWKGLGYEEVGRWTAKTAAYFGIGAMLWSLGYAIAGE